MNNMYTLTCKGFIHNLYIYIYIYIYILCSVHCGFNDGMVSCFTNLSSDALNIYVDGKTILNERYSPVRLNVQGEYVISKYTLPTTNWTVGSHLFEASFNSAAFSSCGSGFRPPSYSAVIFKEGEFKIYIKPYLYTHNSINMYIII